MSTPHRPVRPRPWTTWLPLGASLAVVFGLATVGSFGASFGVATTCTNDYSCSVTASSPCRTALDWLRTGWALQGALLAVGVLLAVLAALRRLPRTVRVGALLLGPVSILLFAATTSLASRSF